MKNLLAILAASSYAQEEIISVSLTKSAENVEAGSSLDFICSWVLNGDYNDYDEDNFQMFWKLEQNGDTQTVASWEPDAADEDSVIYYLQHSLENRVTVIPSFDGRNATMQVADLRIADDNMDITCEIHWGRRFEDGKATVQVYDNADLVELEEISSTLEGRTLEFNGTLTEPESQEVATCSVSNVYPKPAAVTFRVGDEDINVEVAEEDVIEEADGTFSVKASLVLEPEGQYNGDLVDCISIAAEDAPVQQAGANDTFSLDVYYYTNDVELVIGGQADRQGEGAYSVVESQVYTVSCQANGNPAPELTITDANGEEITNGGEIYAVRAVGDTIQKISCSANNNEEGFMEQVSAEEDAELDVYYIGNVDVGSDETGELHEGFARECNVQGHPAPKIQWTKGSSSQIVNEGTLDLGSLSYDDKGEYTCTASNAAGSESDSFSLDVDGPCIVDITAKNTGNSQEVAGQASLELKCSVQGPECTIVWESSLPEFVGTGNNEFDQGVSTLTFSAFERFAEPVEFVCMGENEHGTEKDSVEIGEDHAPACCQPANTAALGTGAIVGIVIAIPAILIIIGAAVFFCRKKSEDKNECVEEGDDATEPEKQPLQADHDGEGGDAGDEQV